MMLPNLIRWALEPPHFNDRRLQACSSVVFAMVMILLVWWEPGIAPGLNDRIIDWSFATLISVVGIFHTARGFDEYLRTKTEKSDPG